MQAAERVFALDDKLLISGTGNTAMKLSDLTTQMNVTLKAPRELK
jgi:hypothetical protein